MVLESLYNATDNLINQQFYKEGRDIIIGRTPEVSLKISNSGQIVRKFKDIFNENLHLFLDGEYLKFLNLFKKIKGMDENYIQEINLDLELKFENLKSANAENINTVIIYSLVLNSLISSIRDLNFEEVIKEIKRRIKNKITIPDSRIQHELDKMFMRNDDNVSILYNISYLDTLAESFNYKKVAKVCKIQISRYVNRIVNNVVNSHNKNKG